MSLAEPQWSPTSVQVTVLQARGLRIKGKNGTNDAYAVMQVGKEKYQTSVVEKSFAPVWKEEASFDMMPNQGAGGGLHVQVLHRALVGPDKLLGQAVINLGLLSEDKSRNKTEWFKLLDKTGKHDKDRGEVLVDIQFLRNNMTASMFDLSAAGKSRSRLGKFKDKVRGKKKDTSDTSSNVVPSFTQVLTDSEEEGHEGGEASTGKDEKKKKLKMKSLFSPKSNLQKNMSQSMSVLPAKNSSLSGSLSSGLNVDTAEGKKKFKFKIHKRTGSSDTKNSSFHQKQAVDQSNVCINGSHVYCEEPQARTSRTGSNYSLASSGHGSMDDVPDSSPPSVDSLRAARQYSPWTEEEEEEVAAGKHTQDEEEELRLREEERLAEEKKRQEEERRAEEERMEDEKRRKEAEELERLAEEKRRREQEEERMRRMEEERLEEERRRKEAEELERLTEERKREEEKRRDDERIRRVEEDRVRRQEEELKRLAEEKRREEEEKRRIEEERVEREREEKMRRDEEERKRLEEEAEKIRQLEEEERERLEEAERVRQQEEEERIRQQEEERVKREKELERLAVEKKRREEEDERQQIEEEERMRRKEEEIRLERERKQDEERKKEEEERARRLEEEWKLEEEKMRLAKEERERQTKEEEARQEEERRAVEERMRQVEEELKRKEEEKRRLEEQARERMQREEEEEQARKEKEQYERIMEEKREQEEKERKRIEAEEQKRREEEHKRELEEQEKRKRMEEEEAERIKREEEERIRKEKEEYERLMEEQQRQEELEKRRVEEERARKKEQEKIEEERRRKKEEEEERLAEEKRRLEKERKQREEEEEREEMERLKSRQKEEEKIKREKEERIRENMKKEEEVQRLEKEKFEKEAEEEKKRDRKSAGMKVDLEICAEAASTNPFDENYSYNPFEEIHKASAEPDGCQSATSTSEKDLISSQRGKRAAPPPPGKQTQKEQDGPASHHVTPSNEHKDAKSLIPKRSVKKTTPGKGFAESTQSSILKSTNKVTTSVAKPGKRLAPPVPGSVESESKLVQAANGNTSKAKQEPVIYGLNPFEEDENEDENEHATKDEIVGKSNPGSVQWPPPAEKDTFQTKVKSPKMAPAPPLPVVKTDTSSSSTNQSTEGGLVTGGTDRTTLEYNETDNSESQSHVHVREASQQESQHATVQYATERASVKKEAPPPAPRRLQPVKPLNPLEQSSVPAVHKENENKSAEIICEVPGKTKVDDTGIKGPYSQLTKQELISMVLKQENKLTERDRKISELEQYIDNLLVRVIEEAPTILMSMNSEKKPV